MVASVDIWDAEIASDTMIGAGTLVGPGKHLEGGYLYLGSPAKKVRELTEKEISFLIYSAKCYVDLKNEYLT